MGKEQTVRSGNETGMQLVVRKKLSTHINRCAYAVCANQSIKRKDIEIRLIFPTNTTAENCVITGIHTLSCILAGNTLSKIHHVLIKQRNGIKFPGGQLLLGPRDVFAYLWGTQNALTQIQIHSNSLHSAPFFISSTFCFCCSISIYSSSSALP